MGDVTITDAPDASRTRKREAAVQRRLRSLCAPEAEGAAAAYDPLDILEQVRMTFREGERQHHCPRAAIQAARSAIAEAFGADAPAPDGYPMHSDRTVEASVVSIQIQSLNMSDPPPARQVAYFTHQVARALRLAYDYGWSAGRACYRAELDRLEAEWRSARAGRDAFTQAQRAALDAAKALAP